MDASDKDSCTEPEALGHVTEGQDHVMDISNFPSHVNILKPQIDKIFSEVQKNLPTIDFDSSDMSSDSDEPIFFHQNLKLSELSSVFDDDKDLDTSLSQGDDTQFSVNSLENIPSQISGRDKNISAKGENENEHNDENQYDNDLAAFLSKVTFPTEDEFMTWRVLAKRMKDSETEIEMREEADLKRSQNLGHFSIASCGSNATIPCKEACTSMRPDITEYKENENINYESEDINCDNKNWNLVDTENINLIVDTDIDTADSRDSIPVTVQKFNQRLHDGMRLWDASENKKSFTNNTQGRDEQIISKFTLLEPTTLSLRLFEELDLDSVLNAANEGSNPSNSFSSSNQIRRSHYGEGDKKTETDFADDLTLIQKLAQLSALQSGTDIKTINSLDPQTGAAKMRGSISTSSHDIDTACQTQGVTTSCAGTSTDSSISKAKILYGRPKHEKRDSEPATVFIDLRGFECQKEDERKGLINVQRVLRIDANQGQQESSSDDDDEMVERCDWRLTRQKIKQNLSAHGASSSFHHVQKETADETRNKPKYKKPPRVISLQEHAVCRQLPKPNDTKSTALQSESTRNENEDNKTRMRKLEMEKEKEHQRKEILKRREAEKKEREERLRMSEHIADRRSVVTTQGRQPAGEITPIVFDIEVSYEPAPTTLPGDLATEIVLLTVHLSSNGEIVQYRNRPNHSIPTEEGMSSTYIALLSWLLSLVPQEATSQTSCSSAADKISASDSTFHVVGLQQLWLEEELRLYVVVAPSKTFYSEVGRHSGSKKGKKQKGGIKGNSRFAQYITKFLSVNTLHTVSPWLSTLVPVEVRSVWSEEKDAPQFTYPPPLPRISTKPLSTFVQVNPDDHAAKKICNIPVGFLWQTVDSDEGCCNIDIPDVDIGYDTQNTVSLIYKKIFRNPISLMAILCRIAQEGLDLAGIRLLYPCPELLETHTSDAASSSDVDTLENVGPVLALALRGTFARTVWLDSVGPSDPQLARRTDPNSLCALFGGESRDNVLLFCPRNPSRTQSELTRWFGGRIPKGATSVDVGLPYLKKEEVRGKRWKKSNAVINPDCCSLPTQRPPAALTATCKADIVLVVSPLVPTSYFGVLLATCQRRGYQIRGVKKLLLTSKLAGSIGISKNMQPFFCPGVNLDELCKEGPVAAVAPCTICLLRKENAAHSMQSLIEAFMVQLTMAGFLGCVQMRINEKLTSRHLFNMALYTDGLLALMGGNLSKVPELDMSNLRRSSSISESFCKHLEQIVVVIMLGHDLLKTCGIFVAKILNVLPYSNTPVQAVMAERFELLGLKWVPTLSMHQAKELTPYEVGERMWRQSVHSLMTEPALVLVLRGVNIFNILKPVIDHQQLGATSTKGGLTKEGSLILSKQPKIEVIMSHNPSETDAFTRLFFHQNELYPDPLSRSLLPYLPEFRFYFNVLEKEEDGKTIRICSLKLQEELDLTQENIMEEMIAGQQSIITLLLIKPRAVQKYLQIILRKIVQEQIGIVGLQLLMLRLEIVGSFIPSSHKKDVTSYQKHVEALTSGPALAIALQQQNAVNRLCELIGPEDPVIANRQSQFLWRGEFGTDVYNNGLYCSATYVDAVRDVKLLFPDGVCCDNSNLLTMEEICAPAEDSIIDVNASIHRKVIVTYQPHKDSHLCHVPVQDVHHLLLQTTCVVLTPPLMVKNPRSKDVPGVDLLAMFLTNGFELVGTRLVWLTQLQAECFLCLRGGGSFEQVTFLCSGPCLVLAMQRDNAVVAFNSILTKHGETPQLITNYGHLIIQPNSITQSQALLAFFFDRLVPGSQLNISSRSHDNAEESVLPKRQETPEQ